MTKLNTSQSIIDSLQSPTLTLALAHHIKTNKWFSYRRETALQGGSVLAKSRRRYYAEIKVYLQPLWRNRPPKLSNSVI